jgi:transcriptional regulator with XRE-family HTH domain
MDINAFWNRVKILLKEKGVTQVAMAKACGFSPATFKGWMAKLVTPTVDSAFAIAQYLDVSLEYLISGRGLSKSSKTRRKQAYY